MCSPSTSGALRLTPFGFAQDRLRTNGLPFVLSVAERSRSVNAGSQPAPDMIRGPAGRERSGLATASRERR